MKKKIPIKTLYLIGVISIGLMVLAVGSTYAMFTASASIENPISLNTELTSSDDIIDTVSFNVSAYSNASKTITIKNSYSTSVNYTIWYFSTSSSGIEYGCSGTTTGSVAAGSSLSRVVKVRNNTSSSTSVTVGVSFSTGEVVLGSGMNILPTGEVSRELLTYIKTLYNTGTKSTVTNNGNSYYANKTSGIMNDRSGATATLASGTGNLRYYGASPSNYIYFNCSDYSNQNANTCEVWRIIGIIDGKVKLIRGSSIGMYSWDTSSKFVNNGGGINEWSLSDTMKLLNDTNEAFSVGGSLYWDSKSGTCYNDKENATTSCDFTNTGIKNAITKNLIASSLWNVGGYGDHTAYVEALYNAERGTAVVNSNRTTVWAGNVALAYPSDVGYATDFASCNTKAMNGLSACKNYNWMISLGGNWLLTSNNSSGGYTNAWILADDNVYKWGSESGGTTNISPVIYLKTDALVRYGDGTSGNPYQLSIVPDDVDLNIARSGKTVTATVTNNQSDLTINKYEYYISTNASCPTSGYTSSTSNTNKFTLSSEGNYFVCVRLNGDNRKILTSAFTVRTQFTEIHAWRASGGTFVYTGENANGWISFDFRSDRNSDVDHFEFCTADSNSCTPSTTLAKDKDSYITSSKYIRYRSVSVFGTKGPIDYFHGVTSS